MLSHPYFCSSVTESDCRGRKKSMIAENSQFAMNGCFENEKNTFLGRSNQ